LSANAIFLSTRNRGAAPAGVLDFAVGVRNADAYAVWQEEADEGIWRRIASRGLSDEYRKTIPLDPSVNLKRVQAIEDLQSDRMLAQYSAMYAAEGVRSMIVVPLSLEGPGRGTLTFYWRQGRRFSVTDQEFATALSSLTAAALNTSELHEQNRREKRRLSFLAEASSMLASSLDYETTLHRVAQMAVPGIADWCTVHVVNDGAVNRIVVAHADPAMLAQAEELSRRYPEVIEQDRGLGLLLRTGETEVWTQIPEGALEQEARDPEHLRMLQEQKISSSILVALKSRGKVLGALRLLAAGGRRHFTPDDVQLAEDLARRAAAAIENAQLHRAVLKQESQLRLSHAAARMGSWSWDLKRRTIFWSDEFKALHRLPLDTEPGFDAGSTLVHPEDRDRVMQQLKEVLASATDHLQIEHRFLAADGQTLWIQSRGSIQRDEKGEATGIVGISMDVSDQRQAEHALRRTEKLAAAGRLAATIAHEINNPLESLTNLVYLASTVEGLPSQARTFLQIADGELSRMAHIVRQTLGFYRESAQAGRVDVGAIVSDVSDLYRTRAQTRGVELSCDSDAGMFAYAVCGEIRQVIANLVANAIDAAEAHQSVCTRVSRAEGSIVIKVIDTGTGIGPDHLRYLFEPFFTTKANVGTGLGLWVSKGIVDKHPGTIEVESSIAPGRSGTMFTVRLLEPDGAGI
jgi:PAS domain S-box-containing protein